MFEKSIITCCIIVGLEGTMPGVATAGGQKNTESHYIHYECCTVTSCWAAINLQCCKGCCPTQYAAQAQMATENYILKNVKVQALRAGG